MNSIKVKNKELMFGKYGINKINIGGKDVEIDGNITSYLFNGGENKIKKFKKMVTPDKNISFLISSKFSILIDTLQEALDEINLRAKKFKSIDVSNIVNYNKESEDKFFRKFYIFNINSKIYTEEELQEIEICLDVILRRGRSFGIHPILFIKEKNQNKVMKDSIFSNFPTRIPYFNKDILVINYSYGQKGHFDVLLLK